MVVMVVTESKVTRAALALDPRDLQDLLVSMERMAQKENLAFQAKMEVGVLVNSLPGIGKSVYGIT